MIVTQSTPTKTSLPSVGPMKNVNFRGLVVKPANAPIFGYIQSFNMVATLVTCAIGHANKPWLGCATNYNKSNVCVCDYV